MVLYEILLIAKLNPFPFASMHQNSWVKENKTWRYPKGYIEHLPTIGQVFQSEEEFSHQFLCPSIPDYVTTYVVEHPVTGDIADMFSFRDVSSTSQKLWIAQVTAVIVTKSPAKQLITDMLIIVKQQQFNAVLISS